MHTLWTAIFYRPLYNVLLFFISVIPHGDVGVAVIVLTLLVKFILFPLTQKSIYSQLEMKALEPEIAKIKETVTDKAEQSKRTYALYKEKKVNPFSSCLLVLIQLPVIIALYWVFLKGLGTGTVPAYSFLHAPDVFNMKFLGFFDIAKSSIVLAVVAGITQYIQGYLAKGRQGKPSGSGMSNQFAETMQTQMLYVLPVMIVIIAYRVSAAVALYWITSNIFTIGQELYTRNKMKKAGLIA
ncbi:MAG: YidC/Oxa1 family membrane protein insertase [bacterium]